MNGVIAHQMSEHFADPKVIHFDHIVTFSDDNALTFSFFSIKNIKIIDKKYLNKIVRIDR